jgi:sulfoxide reductase heme-binding subunit YedZ
MKDAQFAKFVLIVNGLVPGAMLAWDALDKHLGANPAERALHVTGTVALIFLLLTLSVTPIRKITGYNFFSHFRRSLGLFAFFYGVIHLGIWFVVDRSMNLRSAVAESLDKTFILVGMATLLIMVPLAITSTNGMIKRMGAAKWKRLHSLVYAAGIGGAVHFYMVGKVVNPTAVAFAVVLAVLLGFRVIAGLRKRLFSTRPVAGVR